MGLYPGGTAIDEFEDKYGAVEPDGMGGEGYIPVASSRFRS